MAAIHPKLLNAARRLVAYDVEEALDLIAEYLDEDASYQSDDSVRSCVESAAENVRLAALDYYASMK